MKITERYVNESHLEEVYQLLQKGEKLIDLDIENVKSVLVGKEGFLYEAYKDDGAENGAFMEEFFDTVSVNVLDTDEVKNGWFKTAQEYYST